MADQQNGGDTEVGSNRFVDHVEETINMPTCRQFTRSELQEARCDISSESAMSAQNSFRETAYLNNLNDSSSTEKTSESPERSTPDIIVTEEEYSSEFDAILISTTDSDLEKSIDRTETILEDVQNGSSSDTVTVTKNTKVSSETFDKLLNNSSLEQDSPRQEFQSETISSSSVTGVSSVASERELFMAETNMQPLMTVDPSEISNAQDQVKQSPAWDDFLSIRQKRESFGKSTEQEQFEKILEEQVAAQKEKERREQAMMDRMLGTIPAYRGDWKQPTNAGSESVSQVVTVKLSAEYQQTTTASSESVSQVRQLSPDHQQATIMAENTETVSAAIDSSTELSSVENLTKAVLAQGSVTEPSSLIEVERKFVVTEKSEERLADMGATLLSKKSFQDVYFDTSGYKLILADCWLRQREDKWELKKPVQGAIPGTTSTQYAELTDQGEIIQELIRTLDLDSGMSKVHLQELVHIGLLSEFCRLTTTRKSFGLKSCTVDLDETNFGFKVGEIEVVVLDRDRIPEALETIEDVAKQLGLKAETPRERVPGKINAYLAKFNPPLYRQLVDCGVLSNAIIDVS